MFKKLEIIVIIALWIITPPIAFIYELIYKPLGWIKTGYLVSFIYTFIFAYALVINYYGRMFFLFDVSDLSKLKIAIILLSFIILGLVTFFYDNNKKKLI